MNRIISSRLAAALVLLFLAVPAFALDQDAEIVALVEMPVATARVVEVEAVPAVEVGNVVTVLNDLDIEPLDFLNVMRFVPLADVRAFLLELPQYDMPREELVEVVRYVPTVIDQRIMLVDDDPDVLFDMDDYMNIRRQEGLRGTALAAAIHEALRARGVPAGPKTFVVHPVRGTYIPTVVTAYVDRVRGGWIPPGQAKKLDRDVAWVPPGQAKKADREMRNDRDRDVVASRPGKDKAKMNKGGNDGKGRSAEHPGQGHSKGQKKGKGNS
jgi:hypothetical protein